MFDLDDLDDDDRDGIVDEAGVGVGIGVGVGAFESAAGLGLTRLREPMAHVERGEVRGFLRGYQVRGVAGRGRDRWV